MTYYFDYRFKTLFDSIRDIHVNQNPFEEDQDNSPLSNLPVKYQWRDVWFNFLSILKGDMLCRSANILHVLGSVSVRMVLFNELKHPL